MYILEESLVKRLLPLLKAWKGDTKGNFKFFKGTARNFNPSDGHCGVRIL